MRLRATIIDIIEAGLDGNRDRVRAYTELLLQRIESEGDTASESEREADIRALRRVLEGRKGHVIYPTSTQQSTVMVQGAITLFLETHGSATAGLLQTQFPGVHSLIEPTLSEMVAAGTVGIRSIETESQMQSGQPVYCLRGYPHTQVERLQSALRTVLFQLQGYPEQGHGLGTPEAMKYNVRNAIAFLTHTLNEQ